MNAVEKGVGLVAEAVESNDGHSSYRFLLGCLLGYLGLLEDRVLLHLTQLQALSEDILPNIAGCQKPLLDASTRRSNTLPPKSRGPSPMTKRMIFGWEEQAKSNSKRLGLEKKDLAAHMQHLSSKETNRTEPALWVRSLRDQAAKTGKYNPFFLDEVKIVYVSAKQSPTIWSADDLVNFDHDIIDGLLEVCFKDIVTSVNFGGYIIEANACKPDGQTISDDRSSLFVKRPPVVGTTVTKILNLHPGTTYYVKVYAVGRGWVQISPKQDNLENNSTTTLLTAPILDLRETKKIESEGVDVRMGMDGKPIINSKASPSRFGQTYFQFKAIDESGNTIDSKLLETNDGVLTESAEAGDFFNSVLSAECHELTFSVSMGYMDGNMYKCLSDTASVKFKPLDHSELIKSLGFLG